MRLSSFGRYYAHNQNISWGPDSAWLMARAADETERTIQRISLNGEVRIVARSEGQVYSPSVSPDGRVVAYVSDESGQPDVYVTAWPSRAATPARTRVSQAGGSHPRWTGRSLYFLRGNGEILRADPLPGTDGANLGSGAMIRIVAPR